MLDVIAVAGRPLSWMASRMREAMELRQLRGRFPSAHRRLVSNRHGIRVETDSEYLLRLRAIAAERPDHEWRGQMSLLGAIWDEMGGKQRRR